MSDYPCQFHSEFNLFLFAKFPLSHVYWAKKGLLFHHLTTKIGNKILGWQSKLLSVGRRLILIKHVLQSIPMNILAALDPLKQVLLHLDRSLRSSFGVPEKVLINDIGWHGRIFVVLCFIMVSVLILFTTSLLLFLVRFGGLFALKIIFGPVSCVLYIVTRCTFTPIQVSLSFQIPILGGV